jgi:hypothetical protein
MYVLSIAAGRSLTCMSGQAGERRRGGSGGLVVRRQAPAGLDPMAGFV